MPTIDDREVLRRRLIRVLGRLRPAVHRTVAPLDVAAWAVDGGQGEPVPPSRALPGPDRSEAAAYVPIAVGDPWGPAWGTTWLHLTGRVPPVATGCRVELVVDLGWGVEGPGFQAEGLVYRPDGVPVKGLAPRNAWVPVVDVAVGGEDVDIFVEAASNPVLMNGNPPDPTPLGEKATAGDAPRYRLARADVTVVETEVAELVCDLEVAGGLMLELADTDPRHWQLARAVSRSLDAVDLDDLVGSAAGARDALADVLASPAVPSAHRLSAVGHAHIDSAWLWPLRETVRKVARTASNVVDLLESDPDLVYAMSSAQQFAWLAEHRPEVFERVRAKVAEGRFVPVGGMWVEADTNLPGGEAMARQLVAGKRYFLDTFGVETREVWLPDSFGYSAALPQLVALSGSRWFLSQKLSWSSTNPFPHHSFWWEGLDGTRVFTHFPPVDTYNSELSAAELAHAVANSRDRGVSTRSLVPFGYGDGGGGPTREVVSRARRTADLEGSPRVVLESPAAFFDAAEAELVTNGDGAVWVGELYLELHRGTYTSQLRTKQGNRRSEQLLREAELWATTAALADPTYAYPYDALDRLWKTVLLHQFHDILPGSSIAWVHREARETYRSVATELEQVVADALAVLTSGRSDDPTDVVVLNAAPQARHGVPALGGILENGTGTGNDVVLPDGAGAPVLVVAQDGGVVLDNGLVRVVVDRRGLMVSVVDVRSGREVVPPGAAGGLLQLHPDLPNEWDAWDLDAHYRNRVTDLVDVDAVEVLSGAVVGVRVVRTFGASRVVQDITLEPGAARVDVRTEIDWHETEKVLKAAFPIDVHTDHAAYETQFGHLRRPTHVNTSWDGARFEVCAHRFVHVGETGFGVAVVNDSTYGHDVTRHARPGGGTSTTVRLTLLRAPRFPDPETDQGPHELRYALVVGAGTADAVREGYALNLPERRVPGDRDVVPVVRVEPVTGGDASSTAVVVEAVKLADDRSGDLVVRLYESLGGRARARLVAAVAGIGPATEVDLLERPVEGLSLTSEGTATVVELRPFQVLTLRWRRGAGLSAS